MNFKIIKEDGYKDSIFGYHPNFLNEIQQQELIKWLEQQNEFNNEERGENSISRLQKWFQKDGEYFCNQWKQRFSRWESCVYDDILNNLQNKIQLYIDSLDILNNNAINPVNLNSCLINKYRDGNDYIKPHRDTSLSFGDEPLIVGLSIGCPRKLMFKRVIDNINNKLSKRDKNKSYLDFSLTLDSGSLFIMMGSSQRFWSHEIPKSDDKKERYSFTFREYILPNPN